MARAGLFGKASRLLLSSGLAPNTDITWRLLLSKHPSCPPPVAPLIPSTPATIGPDFNMFAILHSFPKDTVADPSGLRIQHLLDAATIPLPTSICSALRDVVNLMASDIRPIAVGETLRRLTGKCLCAVIKDKASELFHPLQFGVACSAGSEKIIHGLRKCIEDHWDDEDFVVLKVDMRNAFNLVSRQAILDECASLFPELLPWCELFSRNELSSTFPVMIKSSQVPHFEILGAPIGDFLFCSKFIASRHKIASKLLSKLEDVASIYPQVALILLRLCAGFCKMVHVARTTPPHLAFGSLESFDSDVRMCFSNCVATDISDVAWKQAQLGLSYGGLGLRSISHHSCAAYIASLSFSGLGSADNPHLVRSIVRESCLRGWTTTLLGFLLALSCAFGLHLDPNVLQIAVKWWLRDVFLSFCHQAHIAARLEAGSDLTPGLDRTRPADVLVRDWAQGKPAAFDITVTSPLTPAIFAGASRMVGAAAEAAENRKHTANDPKCAELGWRCVPLAVETYCNWGEEARRTFTLLATRLAFGSSSFRKARVISDMFGRLNITLVRAIARAIGI
eukprot:Em0016g416a